MLKIIIYRAAKQKHIKDVAVKHSNLTNDEPPTIKAQRTLRTHKDDGSAIVNAHNQNRKLKISSLCVLCDLCVFVVEIVSFFVRYNANFDQI